MASAKITLSSGETIIVSGSVHEVMAKLSRGRWVEFVNADGEQVAVNPFLAQSVIAVSDDGDFIRPRAAKEAAQAEAERAEFEAEARAQREEIERETLAALRELTERVAKIERRLP